MKFSDETPREEYTIAGETFKIIQPFTEGHVLTAGEASQLNQVFAENIRNNTASKVDEQKEAGAFDHDSFQLELDDYMGEYEMGVRKGGGGRVGDPVKQEFMVIAKEKIKDKLRSSGKKLKDYKAADITEMAEQYWAHRETKAAKVLALAKKRVHERQEIAEVVLDEIAA